MQGSPTTPVLHRAPSGARSFRNLAFLSILAGAVATPTLSFGFDTGVSDDRVSLPEGPGSLEGLGENVSVDPNMGLMRYAVPVIVPQGFQGMTPALAFGYTSGGSSGVLGMGWSMDLPSIERMTMRGVPRYEETDLFVANGGQELVRVSQNVADGEAAIYRNRFESDFTRYLWHDRNGGTNGYWEVQYADGRVGFFGADANGQIVATAIEAQSNQTFKYHLVEMVDVYDHRMRMSYVKDGNISLASSIEYVFTTGQPSYRVQFAYEARPDAVSDAKAGFDRILTQRMAGVDVSVRGERLRRYALRYDSDDVSGRRSRLNQIETFGRTNERYPVVHGFGYSRGLGAQCDNVDCGQPVLTNMTGQDGLGVDFQSGSANLVDINGDSLPDLIDASNAQARHRFFLNELSSNGSQSFSAPSTSANGEVSAFALANPRVQFLDVNGDGFTDLLSGGTASQSVLLNRGTGDWSAVQDLSGSPVWNGVDVELRFMDYDNDMDVDLIRSTATETFVFENDGDFNFARRDLAPLGVAFSENIQFTDMNGDGLLEVVQLQEGLLRYKTNFGRGRFADTFTTLSHPFRGADVALALVEDLDSDGFADIFVASGNTLRYVLNRNGEVFEPVQTISQVGGQSLPNRETTTTVVAADMNGNGSVDIAWISGNGSVQYLDLFPLRSHLLTRIENGLGRVTIVDYEPSVQQRALAAEEGRPWNNPLPHPMVVVSRTEEFEVLTDVRDTVDYRYFDGFYDGVERQFRGYAEVEQLMEGDASRLPGRKLTRYDVGQGEPHLNGRLLFEQSESDGEIISQTTHRFGDANECPVAEVPDNATLVSLGRRALGYACEVETEVSIQEGLTSDQHVTTRTLMVYSDGYGNVTRTSDQGVVAVGGGACSACSRSDDLFGAPCGGQCLGDEAFVDRSYVPNSQTSGRWLLDKLASERRFAVEGGTGQFSETRYHYDGDDFVGLPVGQLTQGKLTRTVSRVDDQKDIEIIRHRFDGHGNAVETLDPLGSPGSSGHRRLAVFDDDGLRVVQSEVFNTKADGTPYSLRMSYQFDGVFDKAVLASSPVRVEGNTPQTPADPTAYTYDEFGRLESILLPGGDSGGSPSVEFSYDLGNPTTRIITRRRSQVGGSLDLESIRCVDGRGRSFQTRTKTAAGKYNVSGFTVFNIRSQPLEIFQPYESEVASCDTSVPSGVLSTRYRYDGLGRLIETIHPDANTSGGPTVERVVYEPLRTLRFDGEDTDANSPHFDTPEVRTLDGLGRIVSVERRLSDEVATTTLEYDALGHQAGYIDAQGNRKAQTFDALGRLLRIEDPNAGTTQLRYDDAGKLLERIDARGVATAFSYDGLNREIERFDPANRQATLIGTEWDVSEACEQSRCPNTAGRVAVKTYPAGADFFGYDVRRRPLSTVRTIDGRTYELQVSFDNADRPVARTFPDGRTLNYRFDDASRLVGIEGVIEDVSYTPESLIASWTHSNGVVDAMSYDQRLRVTGVAVRSDRPLQSIELELDRASNVGRADDNAADALLARRRYTYDAWYRSTTSEIGDRTETLSFDLIDSMVRKNGDNYVYDGRPGAPSAIGNEALTYDAAGCVLNAHGFEHTWDFMGRLVSSEGEQSVRSIYGADHLRIVRLNDDQVTHYINQDFEVRDGVAVIYARIGNDRVARLESADFASTWLGDPDAEVTAGTAYLKTQASDPSQQQWLTAAARKMLVGPEVVALHKDHLGSITLATGEGKEVLGRRAYGNFGNVEAKAGYVDRYGFTGQEHEPHTQLVRFAHRSLSTVTGQWLSPDPAFRALGESSQAKLHEAVARYSYVLNNPGTSVDPDGLSLWKRIKKAVGKKFGRRRGSRNRRSININSIGSVGNVRNGPALQAPPGLNGAQANAPAPTLGRNPAPPPATAPRTQAADRLSLESTGSGVSVASRTTRIMPAFTVQSMNAVFVASGGTLNAAPQPAPAPPRPRNVNRGGVRLPGPPPGVAPPPAPPPRTPNSLLPPSMRPGARAPTPMSLNFFYAPTPDV